VKRSMAGAFLLLSTCAALAQQPYAGEHARGIKALSAEEVHQYLSGAGMGFAKAAELNHFPGPMHVLELADRLALNASQLSQTKQLMDAHKIEARGLGADVVRAEQALDALFANRQVPQASLAEAVRHAALAQAAYRLAHLETHRRMRAVLTDEQVARYDTLRGYTAGAAQPHKHKH
jgi:hypothetical protein